MVTTIPTNGFNVETVKYKSLNFAVWRLDYYHLEGVIVLVDSNDKDRIENAKE